MAQGTVIQGNVLDEVDTENPMAFATVKVKGLDITTETDINGNFELSLLEGEYVLIVDFIGYEPTILEPVRVAGERIKLESILLKSKRRSIDLASMDKR